MIEISALVDSPLLGPHLEIHNVPPDICTYHCHYCRQNIASNRPFDRRSFYAPTDLVKAITTQVVSARKAEKLIHYLAFLPDGEPTIDIHLGQTIHLLEPLGIKIAVMTNAAFIWQTGVQQDLKLAHWVGLKVDAVQETVWREINRPHRSKYLLPILEGMVEFSQNYHKKLVTITHLVAGKNDQESHLISLVQFLKKLKPATAYLSFEGIMITESIEAIFKEHLERVEYLK